MKNGFIQIPIIIAILIGTTIVGGVSYVGVQQYQKKEESKTFAQTELKTQEENEIKKLREELELLREQQENQTQGSNEPKVIERVVEKIVEKPVIVKNPAIIEQSSDATTTSNTTTATPQEEKLMADYLAKRETILDQLLTIEEDLDDREVHSYSQVVYEAVPKIASIGNDISSWQIPNLPLGDYVVKDKNFIRDFQTNLYLRALAIKDNGDVNESEKKVAEARQQIQNNFEYVMFESNKYFGYIFSFDNKFDL